MVTYIQDDTINAVESMKSGNTKVDNGKQFANKALSSLNEIIDSTDETVSIVNKVASVSESQSFAVEQISKSLEGITTHLTKAHREHSRLRKRWKT